MKFVNSPEIRPEDWSTEEEETLANLYANQHERLDNFIFMYAVPARFFRKRHIELHSGPGYFLLFSIFFLVIFLPGLVITALTSAWLEMPAPRLALVAVSLAILNVISLIVAQKPAYKISAIHRVLRNPDQIRALIAWDRKWFGPKMSALMGGSIALTYLVILYLLNLGMSGIRLSAAVLWICAMVTVFLGQYSFSTAMVFFEFKKLSTCRFKLYKLSPFDSFQIQKTSSGLKQLGLVSTMSLPFFLLVLLEVLPSGSNLNIPITAGFLIISYLAVAIGILFPLGFLGDIIKSEKWRLLDPIHAELNQMVDRLQTLSKEDYDHLTHLQTFCQSLRDTRDSFLSLGAVSRIGGALFLSTVSVVLTSSIQIYLNKIF